MTVATIIDIHPLSDPELAELAQHEETIRDGIINFVNVGNAMLAIRDKRLYRQEFATFEEYCHRKWSISTRRAYQVIEAAEVVNGLDVKKISHSPNEAQARALKRVPPAEREKVLAAVQSSGERVTAKRILEEASNPIGEKPSSGLLSIQPPPPMPKLKLAHECEPIMELWRGLDITWRREFLFALFGQRPRRDVQRAIERAIRKK